ncbi:sulfotransferase 1B1-like [Haliotis rufescens]|uniref:sulfotransferase 1B1-like n=1 Tax=Haliotis rufescens TaxID=6454 RepID=UPI001EB0066C|nr:sulfotransferase 1B1-like [Haliotis rufescens]
MSSNQEGDNNLRHTSDGGLEIVDLTNSKGHGFKCYTYDGLYLPVLPPPMQERSCTEIMKDIKTIEMTQEDILICAFQKCGTHWLWEVLEMVRSGVIQYKQEVKETRMIEMIHKEGIEAVPPPRVLNTHLPLRMLPTQIVEKKVKCIQVMRNPKDVCVSMFNHYRDLVQPLGYEGDFDEFQDVFLKGHLPLGSYYDYLISWRKEVSRSPEVPVFYVVYEEMKTDPVKCIKDIARFLDLTVTDQFCKDVADACSFKKMKQVDSELKGDMPIKVWKEGSKGTIYRKGEIGDWKNWFTVAESERFDEIWNEKMKGSGITFTYSPA